MRATVKRVGSVLLLAALLVGVLAAPAMAITPRTLDWPSGSPQTLSPYVAFGYKLPRPIGISSYAVYPYYQRVAISLNAAQGTPVLAAEEGTVVFVGGTTMQANALPLIIIQHFDGVTQEPFTTQYVGVTPSVKVGDIVVDESVVGTVRSIGGFTFSVRAAAYNPQASWYTNSYYGMATLPTNPKYQPAMWHYPAYFVNPVPLFE